MAVTIAVGASLLLGALRGDRTADEAAAEASPTTSAGSNESAGRPLFSPQTARRYVTIGTTDGSQFTPEQIREIARSYQVVVLAKFHGGWDLRLHHEAVRLLKAENPAIEVYAYLSTKYWFDHNRWDGASIDPDWLLRDDHGAVVELLEHAGDPESRVLGSVIDLTDPAYRAWVVGVARSWMEAAPYDGIRFDAADHIGDHGDGDIRRWAERLSPSRLTAYNAAIDTLITEVGAAIAPRRVLYNGISPSPIRGPGRGLDQLAITDGAMDEDFCVSPEGQLHDLREDIRIMEEHPGELLQFRARLPGPAVDEATRARIQRVCVASFLLGWQPGSTHFNMGDGYGVEQLAQQPAEIDLHLGQPTGPAVEDGDLLHRDFEHGSVYVNLGAEGVHVDPPEPLLLLRDGDLDELGGGGLDLAGEDAAFLLTPGVQR